MADGQQVEIDGKFTVGGSKLDPQGRPEEVYNCRCTMVTREPPEILQGEKPRRTYQEWVQTKEGQETTNRNASNGLKLGGKGGIIKENIPIGRSVGASGKNYPVKLLSGNHAKFVEGTEITRIKVIAGYGTKTPIREAKMLENDYKIKSTKWEKVRGTAYILENGVKRKVEVHWYQAENKQVKFKVKRYYDES